MVPSPVLLCSIWHIALFSVCLPPYTAYPSHCISPNKHWKGCSTVRLQNNHFGKQSKKARAEGPRAGLPDAFWLSRILGNWASMGLITHRTWKLRFMTASVYTCMYPRLVIYISHCYRHSFERNWCGIIFNGPRHCATAPEEKLPEKLLPGEKYWLAVSVGESRQASDTKCHGAGWLQAAWGLQETEKQHKIQLLQFGTATAWDTGIPYPNV